VAVGVTSFFISYTNYNMVTQYMCISFHVREQLIKSKNIQPRFENKRYLSHATIQKSSHSSYIKRVLEKSFFKIKTKHKKVTSSIRHVLFCEFRFVLIVSCSVHFFHFELKHDLFSLVDLLFTLGKNIV